MKEIKTYGDQNYKEYENLINTHTYYNYSIDPYEESEENKIARLAREKAIERNKRIESILG